MTARTERSIAYSAGIADAVFAYACARHGFLLAALIAATLSVLCLALAATWPGIRS